MCRHGIPFSLMVGMENDVVTAENSIMAPQNSTQRITVGSSNYRMILLPGIHPKGLKVVSHGGICTPMFIATLFTIIKRWKQPECQ